MFLFNLFLLSTNYVPATAPGTRSRVKNRHTQERLTGREEAHKQIIVIHVVNATREELEVKRARVEAWKPAFTLGGWGSAQGRNWQGLCELLRGPSSNLLSW